MTRTQGNSQRPVILGSLPDLGLSNLVLPGVVLAIAVITGIFEPRFWSTQNLLNVARQLAPLLIVSVGQSIAVISGGLDLSIAATLALAGVYGVIVMNAFGLIAGILTMIFTGIGVGLINGLIITGFQVSPFIVTLGMLSIARGLALIASAGLPIYKMPDQFLDIFGDGRLLGIPVGIVVAIATVIVGHILLGYTIFGRYVYAIGSSTAAAFHSGVNVRATTLLVYALSGATAGIGALVFTSWVTAAQPLAAEGLELKSVAAVVVGGIALTGGSGSMLNMVYGALILGMLSNSLNLIGLSSFVQILVVGLVIVTAVILDRLRRS